MTCASYEPLIALFVEGDLPPHEREGVETHLAACAGCRGFAADLAASQQALHELAQEEVDPGALAAVRHRVSAALPTRETRSRRVRVFTLAAAAAVAVLAVLLQWRDRGAPAPPTPSVAERSMASPAGPSAPPQVMPSPLAPRLAQAPGVPSRPAGTPPQRIPREVHEPAAARTAKAIERPSAHSPLVIKLVTSDPDIVIYWLVEQNGGRS